MFHGESNKAAACQGAERPQSIGGTQSVKARQHSNGCVANSNEVT